MTSQTVYINRHKGFTLMEILVVVGIITIILSFGLFFNFDNYRSYNFHGGKEVLISALEHARAEAISNICRGVCTDGKPHGVYIDTVNHKYVIFQGNDYAHRDINEDIFLDANANITYESGGLTEVVFKQLSGDVVHEGTITLTDQMSNRTSIITINTEGQIIWTN